MKIGDKVKVIAGKHTGKIGTVKSTREHTLDVELPKMARWAFFTKSEVVVVPPSLSPAADVDRMVRLAAAKVVEGWRLGLAPPILEMDIRNLEKALSN